MAKVTLDNDRCMRSMILIIMQNHVSGVGDLDTLTTFAALFSFYFLFLYAISSNFAPRICQVGAENYVQIVLWC